MPYSENPLVSIVIPAYNGMPYLKEAIDSVLNQTYQHIELIVLDDGSTDDTKVFLTQYKDSFYVESHANMGQAATLNKGWEMSKGKIIAYLSADDVLYPQSVEYAVKTFKEDASIISTYSNTELINQRSESIRKIKNQADWDYYGFVMNKFVMNAVGSFF